ncbi:MAG: SDR family NAD(P)-dependent oxidoreductase, partial [Bacteroidota bacterium]
MNIIITGAGKGIGYELTKKFAESADNKVIAISREIKNLLLINENRNVVPISFDLGRIHDEVSELTERIGREIDRLDILINNAGILVKGDFDNFDLGSAKTM